MTLEHGVTPEEMGIEDGDAHKEVTFPSEVTAFLRALAQKPDLPNLNAEEQAKAEKAAADLWELMKKSQGR